ncbi:MAG: VanZ family protein [Lachnospiraceae bacterium]|nr:VanZ family protein [Lachnospiraceae bacterium]
MIKYIIKDLMAAGRYLPYGIGLVILVGLMMGLIRWVTGKRGRQKSEVIPVTLLVAYGLTIFLITFLSREDSGATGMYMEPFSSWGINARNNAYFIENILLFIPLGFFYGWVVKMRSSCIASLLLGISFSFCIESLQLVTGRGVFQVDDILTNGVGMLVGTLLFQTVNWVYRRRDKR